MLDRIGAEKHKLIVLKALDEALQIFGERHGVGEWQETVSILPMNLAAAPTENSDRFITMSRSEFVITEDTSRQLEEFTKKNLYL